MLAYSVEDGDQCGSKREGQSSSCPHLFSPASPLRTISEEQQRLWARDRQKKDNHNISGYTQLNAAREPLVTVVWRQVHLCLDSDN